MGSASPVSQPRLSPATRVPERQNFQSSFRHTIVKVVADSTERQPADPLSLRARGRNAQTRLGCKKRERASYVFAHGTRSSGSVLLPPRRGAFDLSGRTPRDLDKKRRTQPKRRSRSSSSSAVMYSPRSIS